MKNKIWNNQKAFSLIELLGVIIIIGILFAIAVPAINKYIVESKKEAYIRTANVYIQAAREQYAKDEFGYEAKEDEALVIPIAKLEVDKNKGYKSPYGELIQARSYIIVVRKNGKNTFYVALIDAKKYGINVVSEDNLGVKSVLKNKPDLDNIKSLTELKGNTEILIGEQSYKLSGRNDANSSTILLQKN